MFYCRDPKFVYLDCSRCGSTSVMNHLGSHYHLERYGLRRHVLQVPSEMRDWTKFTVVRNPYSRMASVFWLKHVNGKTGSSFEEWLNRIDPWKWAQCRYARKSDHVLKIEEIDKASEVLGFWPSTPFPRRNVSNDNAKKGMISRSGQKWKKKPPLEEMLTPLVKKLIAKRFREDFKEFGYQI